MGSPSPHTPYSPPGAPQLVLLPRVSELPGFHGAAADVAQRREELERYRCLEAFRMAPPHTLAEACARLVCSVSALLHDGALREWGRGDGARGAWVGGWVGDDGAVRGAVGPDGAVPGSGEGRGWWQRVLGCPHPQLCPCHPAACQCDPQGSRSSVCRALAGQCECKPHVLGRRCDRCAPGSYGFGPLGCSRE